MIICKGEHTKGWEQWKNGLYHFLDMTIIWRIAITFFWQNTRISCSINYTYPQILDEYKTKLHPLGKKVVPWDMLKRFLFHRNTVNCVLILKYLLLSIQTYYNMVSSLNISNRNVSWKKKIQNCALRQLFWKTLEISWNKIAVMLFLNDVAL